MGVFNSYEKFEEEVLSKITDRNSKYLEIQYLILFRKWKALSPELLSEEVLEQKAFLPQYINDTIEWKRDADIIIRDILEWNAGYYNKVCKQSISAACEKDYYTDMVEKIEQSVFEVFFHDSQPMLAVDFYKMQKRPSDMLFQEQNPAFHLIFDEVGTGKTVSALYCAREVLCNKREKSKILVICPNNKKEEWKEDIRRQLGVYAHCVENNDEEAFYLGNKNMFFKTGEPAVFIEGQKMAETGSELKKGLDKWSQDCRWDLVIIDEGHLCFPNYRQIRADRAVLLTATPIVVHSRTSEGSLEIKDIRKFKQYILLLEEITETTQKHLTLENLFHNRQFFTQLFREDLGIEPKKRKIEFVYCERDDARWDYLDALEEVKGGMTKLIYEQDDALMYEGYYRKFKTALEKAGYFVGNMPQKVENRKYEELREYLLGVENNRDSYIIFFNTKWPAEYVYRNLVEDIASVSNNVIIAKKFGGQNIEVYPKNSEITAENFLAALQSNIRGGKRVLFITTGASGGTGLNLGYFHGIINYEMPFTCIELEQRFGRVDRVDVMDETDRKMVFLLNTDSNPMLRYSSLKINETSRYMPIRNTILFYPEIVKENIVDLKRTLNKLNELYSEKDTFFQRFEKDLNNCPGQDDEIIGQFMKHIVRTKTVDDFQGNIDTISDETNTFFEFIVENGAENVCVLYRVYKGSADLLEEIVNWGRILGTCDEPVEDTLDSANAPEDGLDAEEYIVNENGVISNGLVMQDKKEQKKLVWKKIVEELNDNLEQAREILDKIEQEDKTENQTASGVFYIQDGKYVKQTVREFRKDFYGE